MSKKQNQRAAASKPAAKLPSQRKPLPPLPVNPSPAYADYLARSKEEGWVGVPLTESEAVARTVTLTINDQDAWNALRAVAAYNGLTTRLAIVKLLDNCLSQFADELHQTHSLMI